MGREKKVAILQSNYLPWKGYFDIIDRVDLFIFHDDLQYTKNDWRNRNKIKTPQGLQWLTVPCGVSEKRLICEVELQDSSWQQKHWMKIQQYYKKAEYFQYYKAFFEELYLGNVWRNLSEMNQCFIQKIAKELLGIQTEFHDSRSYALAKSKSDRVIELLKKVNATHYLSGPAAKTYLSQEDFEKSAVKIEWMSYADYPEYYQFFPPFEHGVSIIDLIFHTGKEWRKYMKSL